jgi:poly(hydroxyalkanoate) depolymerase family esterase
LVVVLHGCTQTAEEAAVETAFNELADREGFVVVYPQQAIPVNSSAPAADGNGAGCWNWFLPEDQQRDTGEPAAIAGITRVVATEQQSDPARIFVTGVSAGADMTVILGATYPDLYAAIAPVAGCPFATCSDNAGDLAYTAMGPRARVVPALVEQGTADALNNYALGRALAEQWLGTDDLADNGAPDLSVPRQPAVTEQHAFDQTPQPGSGDPCVRNRHFPCLGGVAGFQSTYPYTIERFAYANGCDILDFWTIHGLAHAYPHADPDSAFSDPLGPDITWAIYQFFAAHPMTGGCPSVGNSGTGSTA